MTTCLQILSSDGHPVSTSVGIILAFISYLSAENTLTTVLLLLTAYKRFCWSIWTMYKWTPCSTCEKQWLNRIPAVTQPLYVFQLSKVTIWNWQETARRSRFRNFYISSLITKVRCKEVNLFTSSTENMCILPTKSESKDTSRHHSATYMRS